MDGHELEAPHEQHAGDARDPRRDQVGEEGEAVTVFPDAGGKALRGFKHRVILSHLIIL